MSTVSLFLEEVNGANDLNALFQKYGISNAKDPQKVATYFQKMVTNPATIKNFEAFLTDYMKVYPKSKAAPNAQKALKELSGNAADSDAQAAMLSGEAPAADEGDGTGGNGANTSDPESVLATAQMLAKGNPQFKQQLLAALGGK